MSIQLTASQTPAIQQPASFKSISDAYGLAASAVMLNGYKIPDAIPSNLSGPFNANVVRADLLGRYGGANAYAVAWGLAISVPGSGLLLPVTAGHAIIDGPTEVNADITVAVSDNTARVYIWLSQSGTLTPVNNSLTPPAGAQCYLGSCVTSGGNITSVDTSGVLKRNGGVLYRETADNGMPIDVPPSNVVFITKTAFNSYLWDGSAHKPIGSPPVVVVDPLAPSNGDQWYRSDLAQLSYMFGGVIYRVATIAHVDNPPPMMRFRQSGLPIPYDYWIPPNLLAASSNKFSCVDPLTLITLDNGSLLRADQVRLGDLLYSEGGSEMVVRIVHSIQPRKWVIAGGKALLCSESHLLVLEDGSIKTTEELRDGDILEGDDKPAVVTLIPMAPGPVIGFELDGPSHLYIAGGLWAHNKAMVPP